MKFFLILLISGLVLFSGCTTQQQKPDLKIKCCKECTDSFSKSPVGVGPGGAVCGQFTSAQSISTECENYFNVNQIAVAQCEK